MSTLYPRSFLCLVGNFVAVILLLAIPRQSSAEWRYSCPKCGRDLGAATGAFRPTTCGCGWREGQRVSKPGQGGGMDPCLLFSCMGAMTLIVGFIVGAVVIIPKLVNGKPRKRRPRRRREYEDDF